MAYTMTPEDNEVIANLPGDIRAVTTSLTSHTSATSEAHAASAISYGTGTVKKALDTAAGHQANQNNPHGVTAAQAGAVALDDAVMTVTADKIVKRTSTGKVAGDITGSSTSCTGNAVTATKLATARTIALTGAITGSGSFDGSGNLSITTADGTAGATYDSAHSFTTNGYQKLSNRFTLQWGITNVTANTESAVTLPVTFATTCLQVIAGYSDGFKLDDSAAVCGGAPASASQIYIRNASNMALAIRWLAIGY